MVKTRQIIGLLLIISVSILHGCGNNRVISRAPVDTVQKQYVIDDAGDFPAGAERFVDQVVLNAGDIITISFQFTPELNTTQQIRPDGKIALQYIGEITAEGQTPAELRNELERLFASELRNPELTITIESLYSNRIFVGGDVSAPGVIESSARITVMESIIQAGGFNLETASLENVIVIRTNDGYRTGFQLNLEPAVQGVPHIPFYLEPFDIVYVPQKKIVRVNQWVAQYIDGLIPGVLSGTLLIYLLTDYGN